MNAKSHETETLSPRDAVSEIRRIEGLHDALGKRASGLTWMIWGVIAPAIFVSYSLLGIVASFPSEVGANHALAPLFPLLWMPWAALGLAATATLWRSVGLVLPVRSTRMREGIVSGVIIVALIFAGFVAIALTRAPIVELAWVLMAQGLGLTVVGLLGLNCNDVTERRLWVLGGILLLVTSLIGSLVLGGDISQARQSFMVISPLASSLVLFGGGVYLTRRA
ncbi:MAG TPA: hypothetical protein VF992_03635 [Thermoplasmata archaeon]